MLMRTFIKRSIVLLLVCCNCFICLTQLQAQTSVLPVYSNLSLNELSGFKEVSSQWKLAGSVSYDLDKITKSKIGSGTGILVSIPKAKEENLLVSKLEHGNLAIELEFMLAKGSAAIIYLQGRYGIKINDSWGNYGSVSDASGGIFKKTENNSQSNLIIPARMNVSRAPGLWQKMQIFFQAPKFDNNGKKIEDAKFLKIVYNGVVIHENVGLSSPSGKSPLNGETISGPWIFSGNGAIALKSIRYLTFANKKDINDLLLSVSKENIRDRPIIITPTQKTLVQRCFIEYDHKKRTFCVAVGEPDQIHYVMDLSQGALINFWKGGFIDATSMWTERGEAQIAVPLGSKIEVAPIPNFAILTNDQDTWPEKQTDEFRFRGYKLDANGRPTFMYAMNDLSIEDKVIPENNGRFLTRTYKVVSDKNTSTLWFRLAEGSTIKSVGADMFSVNDNSYYIKLANDKNLKAIIRKSSIGQELIVSGSGLINQKEIKYSIIW